MTKTKSIRLFYLLNCFAIFLCPLFLINGCTGKEPASKDKNTLLSEQKKEDRRKMVEKNPLKITVEIRAGKPRLSQALSLEVRLSNQSEQPVMVNRRLAVGYRESQAREIFVEVFQPDSVQNIAKPAQLYQRNYSVRTDYVWLQPGQSVGTSFDLFEWYAVSAPGKYELVIYYQADESGASPPSGVLKGTWSSPRLAFEIYP